MTSRIHTVLPAALLCASMFAHPAAMAAETSPAGQSACAAGQEGCPTAQAEHLAAASHHGHHRRLNVCAPGDQECDPRGQGLRGAADADSRDRHSCRD